MNSPREAQFNALLALIGTAQVASQPAFVSTSRKFVQWENTQDPDLPMAIITKGFEFATQNNSRGETRWRIKALLWIYCLHAPDSTVPGTQLNDLLDAVETVLKPPAFDGNRQTLGGLIDHAFIDGEVMVSEGSLPDDRYSIAVVPITLETGV
jgi:hypothetical protein